MLALRICTLMRFHMKNYLQWLRAELAALNVSHTTQHNNNKKAIIFQISSAQHKDKWNLHFLSTYFLCRKYSSYLYVWRGSKSSKYLQQQHLSRPALRSQLCSMQDSIPIYYSSDLIQSRAEISKFVSINQHPISNFSFEYLCLESELLQNLILHKLNHFNVTISLDKAECLETSSHPQNSHQNSGLNGSLPVEGGHSNIGYHNECVPCSSHLTSNGILYIWCDVSLVFLNSLQINLQHIYVKLVIPTPKTHN